MFHERKSRMSQITIQLVTQLDRPFVSLTVRQAKARAGCPKHNKEKSADTLNLGNEERLAESKTVIKIEDLFQYWLAHSRFENHLLSS